MSDREEVLGQVRRALGANTDDPARARFVRQRLQARPRGPVPARANIRGAARITLMEEKLKANGAAVSRAGSAEEIVQHLTGTLHALKLPLALRVGSDPFLAALPWRTVPEFRRLSGAAAGDDAASCVWAVAGAAETGTLFVLSGKSNPTTLNFLPEVAFVVLRTTHLFGCYEDAFDHLRATLGAAWPPRAVNLIGGPSRTADIEQTIVVGAHGPRALHVILFEG